ncbi:hypothetical protein I552_0090 [Mycobacterium xenopi 3993]|nr:hypothetical protein I552_0090 [Mycobacterium xenopi 3993]
MTGARLAGVPAGRGTSGRLAGGVEPFAALPVTPRHRDGRDGR